LFIFQEVKVGGDIVGHLWGGGGCTIIEFEHAIMQLLGLK